MKEIFASKTFAANTFACGIWRGLGVSVEFDTSGREFTLPTNRPHFTLGHSRANRPHFTLPTNRPHFTLPIDDR